MPYFNIPDLSDFKLKPYVAHGIAVVPDEIKVKKIETIDEDYRKVIEEQIKNAPKAGLATTVGSDPLSRVSTK